MSLGFIPARHTWQSFTSHLLAWHFLPLPCPFLCFICQAILFSAAWHTKGHFNTSSWFQSKSFLSWSYLHNRHILFACLLNGQVPPIVSCQGEKASLSMGAGGGAENNICKDTGCSIGLSFLFLHFTKTMIALYLFSLVWTKQVLFILFCRKKISMEIVYGSNIRLLLKRCTI